MEEFSYPPVTNFKLYPVGILSLTSIFLGLKHQKPNLSLLGQVSIGCLLSAVTVATVWDMSLSPQFSQGVFFHHLCTIPLVYVARGKCVQTRGRIPRNKLLFFLLSSFSLWQRLSLFTEYEVLSRQTDLLAALKAQRCHRRFFALACLYLGLDQLPQHLEGVFTLF